MASDITPALSATPALLLINSFSPLLHPVSGKLTPTATFLFPLVHQTVVWLLLPLRLLQPRLPVTLRFPSALSSFHRVSLQLSASWSAQSLSSSAVRGIPQASPLSRWALVPFPSHRSSLFFLLLKKVLFPLFPSSVPLPLALAKT